jgi:hypothetical protein
MQTPHSGKTARSNREVEEKKVYNVAENMARHKRSLSTCQKFQTAKARQQYEMAIEINRSFLTQSQDIIS